MHSDLTREVLEAHGYRVATARDVEAVAEAQRARPSLILLDLSMPIVDGGEVCRRLRADPATAAIPIVAVSAAPHLLEDPALPVDDRLDKPFQLAELSAVVARWVTPA